MKAESGLGGSCKWDEIGWFYMRRGGWEGVEEEDREMGKCNSREVLRLGRTGLSFPLSRFSKSPRGWLCVAQSQYLAVCNCGLVCVA